MHASLLSIPSLIIIKSLPLLRMASNGSHTLRETQENPPTDLIDWGYPIVSIQNPQSAEKEDISIILETRRNCAERIFSLYYKEYSSSNGAPRQPKIFTSLSFQTHSESHHLLPTKTQTNTEAHDASYGSQQISDTPDEQYLTGPLGFQKVISDLSLKQQNLQLPKTPADLQLSEKGNSLIYLPVLANYSALPLKVSQHTRQKGKEKPMPTRRSQRLHTKQRPTCSILKPLTKSKSQMARLPFDLDSRETPLDASTTLMIFQATGLQVNEKVEQMIYEALKQNHPNDTSEVSTSRTLLHDFIPL